MYITLCNPPVPLGGVTSIFWMEPNSRRDSPQRQPHSQGASCSRFQGEPGNLYIIHHLEPSILLPWEISTLPKNISQLLIPLFKEMAKLFSSIELFLLTINPCWKVKTKILIFDVRLNISSTKVLEPLFIFKSKYLYFAGLSPSKVYVAPHSYFESYENLTPNIIITIIIIPDLQTHDNSLYHGGETGGNRTGSKDHRRDPSAHLAWSEDDDHHHIHDHKIIRFVVTRWWQHLRYQRYREQTWIQSWQKLKLRRRQHS